MDSKEILETFGISKKFSIILFIQSIIIIIGCFLALQTIYINIINGAYSLVLTTVINLLLFLVLIYYSFIGFRKDEKHFKIAVYLYIIFIVFTIISTILNFTTLNLMGIHVFLITFIRSILAFILACYFAYNLDNYDKAKIAILLVVFVLLIFKLLFIFVIYIQGYPIFEDIIRCILFMIPSVSVALTYFARYNKEGFKQLNK